MMDAPDIVVVFVGTPLGTSDHCFVSCLLRVEQSVPEYNVSCHLKLRTNWKNVHCIVRSFTCSTISTSAERLEAFDRSIWEVIGTLIQTTVLRIRSGEEQ